MFLIYDVLFSICKGLFLYSNKVLDKKYTLFITMSYLFLNYKPVFLDSYRVFFYYDTMFLKIDLMI
jgi:hypothetical protein